MSQAVQGVVEFVGERKAGRGTAYSLKVNDTWFGNGFAKPSCKKGDTVKFTWQNNDRGYATIDDGTIEVVEGAPAQAASASTSNSYDDRQAAISYQAARKDALQLVEMALSNDAVKLGTAKADKMGILEDLVHEYTVQFFEDTKVLGKATVDSGNPAPSDSDD